MSLYSVSMIWRSVLNFVVSNPIRDVVQQIKLLCNIRIILCSAQAQIGIAQLQQRLTGLDEASFFYKYFLLLHRR